MTQRDEKWAPLAPWFPFYEASDRGRVRSVDRVINGKRLRGVVLKPRAGNRGYLLVNVRDGEGRPVTRTVHSLVLLAHAGPCPPGQESRHGNDDPLDNRWPENLCYGTPLENAQDKFRNGRPRAAPKTKVCARCGGDFTGNGRRCHDCVVDLGKLAADLLRAGVPLDRAAEQLHYPSVAGVHTLAVRYGGYGAPPPSRLRRVTRAVVTMGDRLRSRAG